MIFGKIKHDLRITSEVFRDLRDAVNRGSLLEMPPPAGMRASAGAPPPWAGLGGKGFLRYFSLQLIILLTSAILVIACARFIPEEKQEFELRMAYLKENPDRYDIIFVGSSRFQAGLPVQKFDDLLRSRNILMKPSFNMGVRESHMHHNFYTIRSLLESGVRPRYLVVEASPFTSMLRGSRIKHFEIWHDLAETVRVLETVLDEPGGSKSEGSRLERSWMHLDYFLRRHLPLGALLEFSFTASLQEYQRERFGSTQGHSPLPFERNMKESKGRKYFDNPDLWDQRIARLERGYQGPYQKPANLEAFEDLIDYVRQQEVQLIFVGAPYSNINWVEPLLWMEQEGIVSYRCEPGELPAFIDFNLPTLPYIRDLDLRFDAAHTNNAGSELWVRDLADAFIECVEP